MVEEEEEEFEEDEEGGLSDEDISSGFVGSYASHGLSANEIGSIETKIASFSLGNRVTDSARSIIKEAVTSLKLDDLVTDRRRLSTRERRRLVNSAIKTLPNFLEDLVNPANNIPLNDKREISGILVLQHIHRWAALMDCPCWPRW